MARSIARSLAACEAASRFPGPLGPDAIVVDGDAARLLGASPGGARAAETASPLWTPPEQQDGAPWDAAANRYVLGLVLYRLIAGEHPFAGAGLRHAMEAARRAPPPFKESVATALPAGLQSLTLRMLDPDAGQRPASARAIEEELGGFVGERGGRAASDARPGIEIPWASTPSPAAGEEREGERATIPCRPRLE